MISASAVAQEKNILAKENALRSLMRRLKSVLVAFSGGVDSSYLALVATQELGDKAICVTGKSPSVSKKQLDTAREIAEKHKFNHLIIDTHELDDPNYKSNPVNRCYFCKTELYGKLTDLAREQSIAYILDGANADDDNDYRPGSLAAKEKKVLSPLSELGFSKSDIRKLSKKQDLMTWDKPASPCLASRIQYGIPVSIKRLSKVEKGEEILNKAGFKEFRVRYHGDLVRLEISKNELTKALDINLFEDLSNKFKQLGFKYVTLDIDGYRSGSLNEII